MLFRVCHFGPGVVPGIKYLQKGREVEFIPWFKLTLIEGKGGRDFLTLSGET